MTSPHSISKLESISLGAHMPQYEKPGKFREILLTIKPYCEEGSAQHERYWCEQ